MKKMVFVWLVLAWVAAAQAGQGNPNQTVKGQTELKEHKCNEKCKKGKHFYKHGEKGHMCTAECKKKHKK